MKYDTIIAIDPGISNGGLTVLRDGKLTCYKLSKLKDFTDLKDVLMRYKEISDNPICFIEDVGNLRPSDLVDFKAYNIQKLGRHVEMLKNIMHFIGIPFVMVHAKSWQSYLKLKGPKGETDTDRKNRYKTAAGIYFKTVKPTLWNADALLILVFGFRKVNQEPDWVEDRICRN